MKKCNYILLLLIAVMFSGCFDNTLNQGNSIVSKIQEYQQRLGKLPNSIYDLKINNIPLDIFSYQKINDSLFSLDYGMDLGESNIYYSDTKSWTNKARFFTNDTIRINEPVITINKKPNYQLLNGFWYDNLEENSLFYIDNDSITYTDSPFKNYLILKKADTLTIDLNGFKSQSLILELTKRKLKLVNIMGNDTIVLIR